MPLSEQHEASSFSDLEEKVAAMLNVRSSKLIHCLVFGVLVVIFAIAELTLQDWPAGASVCLLFVVWSLVDWMNVGWALSIREFLNRCPRNDAGHPVVTLKLDQDLPGKYLRRSYSILALVMGITFFALLFLPKRPCPTKVAPCCHHPARDSAIAYSTRRLPTSSDAEEAWSAHHSFTLKIKSFRDLI